MVGAKVVVIDYEFLQGRQNVTVVKKISVAIANAAETFFFRAPTRRRTTERQRTT